MLLKFLVLVCFVFLASGAPAPDEGLAIPDPPPPDNDISGVPAQGYVDAGNANEFVDMLLENMKKNTEVQLDPFQIPERSIGFNRTVLFVPLKGEMKIHQGVVTGIATLHRTGDCTMVYEKDAMHIRVNLGMGVLKVKATGTVTFQGLGPSVTYTAEIGFADIDMSLAVDIATMKATMTKFNLNTLKGLNARIDGLGPLDYLFNFFSKINTNLFKLTFKFITEKVMATVIKNQLKNMKIPM